ncbi:MAG: MFS transporter [Gammaproteobacteria bacterium]
MTYLQLAAKRYLANYSGLPTACWQGIILGFFNAISIGVCFFMSLYFINTLHISVATAGFLISAYGIGMTLGGILGGRLSDQLSPRIISIGSVLLQSLTFFLLAKLHNPTFLMINLFFSGLAAYGFKTANNTWLFDKCSHQPELRLKTVSVLYAFGNLGLGISGIIIGVFGGYGFENIFYFSSVLLFLSGCYLLTKKDSTHVEKNAAQENVAPSQIESRKENKKIVYLMLGCLFLIGLIIAQLSTTYPLYVQNKYPELGLKAVSILFLLDSALIVVFQAPISNFIKKHNKILVVGFGALLMGLGMLLLNFSFVFLLAALSCVIWTTGEMLFISTAQVVCYEQGDIKKKGQNLGIFQSVFAASIIIGPTLGGGLYQHVGGDAVWYVSGLIGMICFLGCFVYRRYD